MKTNWILYLSCAVILFVADIQYTAASHNHDMYSKKEAEDNKGKYEDVPNPIEEGDSTAEQKKRFFNKIIDYFKESNEDKSFDKKFDISIIGGPHYSSDVKLGLGLVAAGLYRTDKNDTISPPSDVSIYSDVATSGYYLIGVSGNTFFRQSKYRLNYKTYFFSMPADFWGIGYHMGNDDDNRSDYKRQQTSIQVDFMFRIAHNWYLGSDLNFHHVTGKDFKKPELLDGHKKSNTNFAPGIFIMYDSRDYVTAPHEGWFFKLENEFYAKIFGNRPTFNRSELTLDFYHRVWKGGVMAYDLHSEYTSGRTPWSMLARMGGSHRMRGYYEGRYRDRGILEFQAELRQHVWNRIGVTVWGGVGNVFNKLSELKGSQTLPNYGIGLRWEFKKRVNVRLDYGRGKGSQSGFIFGINEAF